MIEPKDEEDYGYKPSADLVEITVWVNSPRRTKMIPKAESPHVCGLSGFGLGPDDRCQLCGHIAELGR